MVTHRVLRICWDDRYKLLPQWEILALKDPIPLIKRAPCSLVYLMPSTCIVSGCFNSHESGILKAMQLQSETRIRCPAPKSGVFCYTSTVERPSLTGPQGQGGQRCFLSCSLLHLTHCGLVLPCLGCHSLIFPGQMARNAAVSVRRLLGDDAPLRGA